MSKFFKDHEIWSSIVLVVIFILVAFFLLWVGLFDTFTYNILPLIYKILFVLSPIAVPIILIYVSILLWVRYVQLRFIFRQQPVLLEIKIPKDIQKSPLAMEIIFGVMQQSPAATYTEAYIDGKVAPWFSLELVSIEGQVHFYIWASEKRFKNLVEAQVYAQYPTVEIYEVPPEDDYVRHFPYDPSKNSMWGIQFGLTKADIYPIKTYVDYNMEADQKDEYRIDPMTAVLEYLGSVGKGQQAWIQILVKKHGKEDLKSFKWKEKPDWQKAGRDEIKKIKIGSMFDKGPDKVDGADIAKAKETLKFPNMTKGQTETIAAIERSIGKLAFDTCLRGFYLAKKDDFNPIYISGLIGSNRQYSSNNLNGFKLKTKTDVSDNFKDWSTVFPFLKKVIDRKKALLVSKMYDAYRLRSFFYPPYQNYKQNPFVLSTEELATMYHFPGNVSATPTLSKIASKKSEPPANLPIKN